MYKKVLYNIKKTKKCGEGEGQYLNPKHSLCIFEPKTLSMFKKKRTKKIFKKLTKPGLEPTTSGLEKLALIH